ncbi:MAG: class D sortase [Oscillospiraceae bacterium]|nr:class D sortase [Oscillospiraceae bacterium]MDD4368114.1 class D sortase [Oscillospiraceae bacterium]
MKNQSTGPKSPHKLKPSDQPPSGSPKARPGKRWLNVMLNCLIGLLAVLGVYFLIKPYWIDYKKGQIRDKLIDVAEATDNTNETDSEPTDEQLVWVDPEAYQDAEEEYDYFIPDEEGNYVAASDPAVQETSAASQLEQNGLVALQPIGVIDISKIGIHHPIVENLTYVNLRYATAHYEKTAAIGQIGNCAIFAHRSPDDGKDFNRLNEVTAGDTFTITAAGYQYSYTVEQNISVLPQDMFSYFNTPRTEPYVILVTCDPIPTWTHRMLVIARQTAVTAV